MLLVKTKLEKSEINGVGLFADENIPKGVKVDMNADQLGIIRFTKEQWKEMEKSLSPESFRQIKMRTYKNRADDLYWKNLDDTSFINHSINPNIEFRGDFDVALRDIKKGEEILIDYTTFYDEEYFQEIMKLQ